MIQVDLPTAFAVGQIFALLSKEYLKKTPEKFTHKLIGPFNFFMSCGFVPAIIYLLAAYPSWEVMYVTDWLENPFNRPFAAGIYALFIVLMILLGNIGYILGHYWYIKGKDRLVIWGSIVGIILAILPFIVRWGVWWQIGTYAQVQVNQGYSFWKTPFFGGYLFFVGYFIVTTVLTGIWFKKKGSKM